MLLFSCSLWDFGFSVYISVHLFYNVLMIFCWSELTADDGSVNTVRSSDESGEALDILHSDEQYVLRNKKQVKTPINECKHQDPGHLLVCKSSSVPKAPV